MIDPALASAAEWAMDDLAQLDAEDRDRQEFLNRSYLASIPGNCPACGEIDCRFDCCYADEGGLL